MQSKNKEERNHKKIIVFTNKSPWQHELLWSEQCLDTHLVTTSSAVAQPIPAIMNLS